MEQNIVTLNVKAGVSTGSAAEISFAQPEDKGSIEKIVNQVVTNAAGTGVTLDWMRPLREPWTLVVFGTVALDSAVQSINVAIHNPGLRLAKAFAAHLEEIGVKVASASSSLDPVCASQGTLIASVTSPSLLTIMNNTLKTSDNLEAELWMRLLAVNGLPTNATNYQAGLARVKDVLGSAGVDLETFMQTDGSGLGRSNMVQPNGCVSLLAAMAQHKSWINLLPIAGVDGTLSNRFIGTPAQGRVFAKTGSITGVVSLSGYVYPKNLTSTPILFSFLVNDSSDVPWSNMSTAIDAVVVKLAELE